MQIGTEVSLLIFYKEIYLFQIFSHIYLYIFTDRNENLVAFKPIVTVFENPAARTSKNLSNLNKATLLTPYERYKLTKPYNETIASNEAEAQMIVTSNKEKMQMVCTSQSSYNRCINYFV